MFPSSDHHCEEKLPSSYKIIIVIDTLSNPKPVSADRTKNFSQKFFLVHTALKNNENFISCQQYFSEYQIKWNKMPNDLVRSVSAFFNRSQRERKSDRRQQRPEINIRTQKNPISNKPEIEFK